MSVTAGSVMPLDLETCEALTYWLAQLALCIADNDGIRLDLDATNHLAETVAAALIGIKESRTVEETTG